MKRALITGITGQDGSYLAELLIRNNYEVYGMLRRSSTDPLMRIEDLVLKKKVELINGDMRDMSAIMKALEKSNPDEIYNLAAQSDVGISFKCPDETWEINYHGLGRLLHCVLELGMQGFARIYQASTSEMFGYTPPPQNETSQFNPVSPYAQAKLQAYQDYVLGYREKYKLFICSGILFNHESPRRGKHFVTRKITHSLAKIHLGMQEILELGNLDAKRDWGFAGDYVEAMHRMMQQDKPDDFVIATGQSHTVREFVELATKYLTGTKISWEGSGEKEVGYIQNDKKITKKKIIKINPEYYRPNEVDYLLGDASKAKRILGWQPMVKFDQLVRMMVESDVKEVGQKPQRYEKCSPVSN